MAKWCLICGNVNDVVGVSVHKYLQFYYVHVYIALLKLHLFTIRFPTNAVRHRVWTQFVENNGL